jgi:hypothetical protein
MDDGICLGVTVSWAPGDYQIVEGKCAADLTPEQEDAFAVTIARRAARRRYWRNLYHRIFN